MKRQATLNSYDSTHALASLASFVPNETDVPAEGTAAEHTNSFRQSPLPLLNELLAKLVAQSGKESFLVFKNNKYSNVATDNIAFFYIKYNSTMIMSFDKQEYFVNYSLDEIQHLLSKKQFYRLNRQYIINFSAIKEVELYFARKLLVNLVISVREKLIVSKEKVSEFLHWLDNR